VSGASRAGSTLGGKYRVARLLGQGGMGSVYQAQHLLLHRRFAVKFLRDDLTGRRDALTRFRREAEAAGALEHENVAAVIDFGVADDGAPFIVMEYLDGIDFGVLLANEGPLASERAADLVRQAAAGAEAAHAAGIVHRDLKPQNLFLCRRSDGTDLVKVLDFGIAKLASAEAIVTQTGTLLGSPAYMAPEQARGEASLDARADVHALGVILYELLSGTTPHPGQSHHAVIHHIATEPPLPLEREGLELPSGLSELVRRALAPNASDRPATAAAFSDELRPFARRRVWPAAGAQARPEEEATTPLETRAPSHAGLRAPSTPFMGRERELAELARLLRDPAARLVTVLGPGGMGKSRFALEAARRISHGSGGFAGIQDPLASELDVVLVELAPLTSAEFVLSALAERLGFRFHPAGDPKAQLLAYLRRRRMLLLLDNFEHVLAAGALVNEILEAAPRLRVLVTSRERLRLHGEHVFALQGLDYPSAVAVERPCVFSSVRLLLESARRVNPDLELTEESERIAARICQQVQGLPLAIVLAASWSNVIGLSEIADEIARSFEFLTAELSDVPERQQSMRAVFDYSCALLSEREREVFARLAVFRGGFTRAAAEEVAGADLRALAALVNKSLVARDPTSGRYGIHELLRQYAQDRGEQSPLEWESASARHAGYYVDFLREARSRFRGEAPELACLAIEEELDNVRRAWGHLLASRDVGRLATAAEPLAIFFGFRSAFVEAEAAFGAAVACLRGLGSEGSSEGVRVTARLLTLHAQALANLWRNEEALTLTGEALALLDPDHQPLQTGLALIVRASSAFWEGHVEIGHEACERAIRLYRRAGDAWELARALMLVARCQDWIGRHRAEAAIREAIELQRALPSGPLVTAASLPVLGNVLAEGGDYDEGCRLMYEGLALSENQGSLHEIHLCLMYLANAERKRGNYDIAEEHVRRTLALSREAFPFAEIWAQILLGDVLKERGRLDEATNCFRAGLDDPLARAAALVNLGDIALQRGQPDAEALLRQGLDEFERRGSPWGVVIACDYLGHLKCDAGQSATAYFRRAVATATSAGLLPLAVSGVAGLARTSALAGDLERAVELLAMVEKLPICERQTLERRVKPLLSELSSRLPPARFDAARARGATLELATTLQELSAR